MNAKGVFLIGIPPMPMQSRYVQRLPQGVNRSFVLKRQRNRFSLEGDCKKYESMRNFHSRNRNKFEILSRNATPASGILLGSTAAISENLWSNSVFKAGFTAWFVAQVLKVLTSYIKSRRWDWRPLLDSGGMPSSHSSLCMGVTTAVAMMEGLGSPLFPVCLGFSAIVMYDASGVRRQAGKHAEVLNAVVNELNMNHPVTETKLKEVLGHSKTQVFFGAVLGVLIGFFVH